MALGVRTTRQSSVRSWSVRLDRIDRNLTELALLVVLKGFRDFSFSAHDERAVLEYRLAQR